MNSREKSSLSLNSFQARRDETGFPQNLFCGAKKNRQVCLMENKEAV